MSDNSNIIPFPGAHERQVYHTSKDPIMDITSVDITPDPSRVVETETGYRVGGLAVSLEDAQNPAILEAHMKEHLRLARCFGDIAAKMAQTV